MQRNLITDGVSGQQTVLTLAPGTTLMIGMQPRLEP